MVSKYEIDNLDSRNLCDWKELFQNFIEKIKYFILSKRGCSESAEIKKNTKKVYNFVKEYLNQFFIENSEILSNELICNESVKNLTDLNFWKMNEEINWELLVEIYFKRKNSEYTILIESWSVTWNLNKEEEKIGERNLSTKLCKIFLNQQITIEIVLLIKNIGKFQQ